MLPVYPPFNPEAVFYRRKRAPTGRSLAHTARLGLPWSKTPLRLIPELPELHTVLPPARALIQEAFFLGAEVNK